MDYKPPSPDSDSSAYLTPPTATILVGAIEEIMGVSWTVMFPDGYSGGISSWTEEDNCVHRLFQDMAVGFPRLEEFRAGGPTEVGQWRRMVDFHANNLPQNQDPIPVRITRPLPQRREVHPNGWGQNSFKSVGTALWGAIPPTMVHGQQAVQSARRPKVLFHPYWSLIHDHRPLARLSDFVAPGAGESQAQAGRGGIGFWGDTSGE